MSLPNELLSCIFEKLDRKSDLFSIVLSNKSLFKAAIPYLWRNPKIGPRISIPIWRRFINLLLEKNGYVSYHDYIRSIDDIWLYVGGEEDASSKILDSKMDLTTTFIKFSLHYSLELLMNYCPNLQSVSIHFHSENTRSLPWKTTLPRLFELDLRMRFYDDMCASVFSTIAPQLYKLNLSWAEISDEGLILLSQSCPNLINLKIILTDIDKRSRYHRHYERGTNVPITDSGMGKLIQNCKKLKHIHIYRLNQVSNDIFSLLLLNKNAIQSLTITLNYPLGITMSFIKQFAQKMPSLCFLRIICGPNDDLSNKIVDESDVLQLPKETTLKCIQLQQLDFKRSESSVGTISVYYGGLSSPWFLDEFLSRFRFENPTIELNILFD